MLTTLAVPKSCFRLEREQLLTARPPLLASSCTAGARNVTQNDKVIVIAGVLIPHSELRIPHYFKVQYPNAAVINVHTIKPIDAACVTQWAEKCGNVVTVEEHSVIGGLGDAVADVLMGKVSCKFRKIGVNDQFGQSGKAADVLREYGLTADQIADRIRETL